MSEWRDIETAPKDGKLILLYPSLCWSADAACDAEVGYWDDTVAVWSSSCDTWPPDYPPTHWMPLPAPPTAEGRTE